MNQHMLPLHSLRRAAGMTQAQIAAILGVHPATYRRYERGQSTIPLKHLLRLADLYRTSTDYLVGRTPVKTPRPTNFE
jgi:transcriptional regulator with XRE-family HTH domain